MLFWNAIWKLYKVNILILKLWNYFFQLYNTTHTHTPWIYNVHTPHVSIECIEIVLKKIKQNICLTWNYMSCDYSEATKISNFLYFMLMGISCAEWGIKVIANQYIMILTTFTFPSISFLILLCSTSVLPSIPPKSSFYIRIININYCWHLCNI